MESLFLFSSVVGATLAEWSYKNHKKGNKARTYLWGMLGLVNLAAAGYAATYVFV